MATTFIKALQTSDSAAVFVNPAYVMWVRVQPGGGIHIEFAGGTQLVVNGALEAVMAAFARADEFDSRDGQFASVGG